MTHLFANKDHPTGDLAVRLRPYQQEAVDGIYRWFGTNTGNPLVVVPTGGGKSLIIAAFVHSVLSQWPRERILIVTHVKELIAQNHAALLRCWPGAPAGIYSAGLKRREHDAPIVVAGIQSIYERAKLLGWADLVIVDEAHLIPRGGMGMYRQLLTDLSSMNPKLKVIGLTATPFRTGEGSLDRGDDRMFHGVAYDCKLVQLILEGYLSPVTSKATVATIDTADVRAVAGDFVQDQLEEAATRGDLVPRAMEEIAARGDGRKSWLLFCCGIEHAKRCQNALQNAHGIRCETVFGETPAEERDRIITEFREGRLQAIANVGVLTTGFDAPNVDLIALLRPTKSPGLYVQMVGRGLRVAPGKSNCLVLDFGGNVARHGPIDTVNLREPRKGDPGAVLARECPKCQSLVSIAVRQCPDCGYEWVVLDGETGSEHAARPDERAIIAGLEPRNPIERWDVTSVRYDRHEKPGKQPTMVVEYSGGFQQRVREWICFEHDGFPRVKAEQWWRNRGGAAPVPMSVEEARCRVEELLPVLGVTVDTRGDWPELRGVRLGRDAGSGDVEGYSEPVSSKPITDDDIPF